MADKNTRKAIPWRVGGRHKPADPASHTTDSTFVALERRIRDLINEPRKRRLLIKRGPLWHQLCASLDAIGDSQLAIDAYATSSGSSDGAVYLAIYGLLQACFLQQDAIHNLCEALDLDDSYKDYRELMAVRELRNDAVGHPTKRGQKSAYRYYSISRFTMSKLGFQMLVHGASGFIEFREVSLAAVIADQRTYVGKLLASVLAKLETELEDHRARFRMKKLTDQIDPQTPYAFENLSRGVYDDSPEQRAHAHMGLWGLGRIRKVFEDFKATLAERDIEIDTYPGIEVLYDEIDYPVETLEAFLNAKKTGAELPLDPRLALIVVDYLRAKVRELKTMAGEMDTTYASKGEV